MLRFFYKKNLEIIITKQKYADEWYIKFRLFKRRAYQIYPIKIKQYAQNLKSQQTIAMDVFYY